MKTLINLAVDNKSLRFFEPIFVGWQAGCLKNVRQNKANKN